MEDSGVSHRASIKRSFSTMANPHREPAPAPAPVTLPQYDGASLDEDEDGSAVDGSYDGEREDDSSRQDEGDEEAALWAYRRHHARRDLYDPLGHGIEHPIQRREREEWEERGRERMEQRQRRDQERGELEEQREPRHFPRDGFDYRRPMPVVDARAEDVLALEPPRVTETVDLTEDGNSVPAQDGPGLTLHIPTTNTASDGGASRAQRLPRYGRDIIDIPSSDEEDNRPLRQVAQVAPRRERVSPVDPRDMREAVWPGTRRTTSTLRRPGWIRQPTPEMELDDVEFVASRNISGPPSRRATPAIMPTRINHTVPPAQPVHAGNDTIDLTADDDDDVIVTQARNTRGGINADRPAVAGTGVGTRHEPDFGGAGIARLRNMVQGHGFPGNFLDNYLPGGRPDVVQATRARLDDMRERRRAVEAAAREARQVRAQAMRDAFPPPGGLFGYQADAMFGMPMMMDYGTAAFDLGLGGRPPTPPYEAPPPPSNGFTRSPEEEEVVVCPNCGDELALSKDEEKQQVWVIKQCGHAYCGTCIVNRSRGVRGAKNTKGKGKARATDDTLPLAFLKCVVAGCGNHKRLGKPDLIRVWINS